MPFYILDFLQVGFVSHRFDALLQGMISLSHAITYDRAKLQPFDQTHALTDAQSLVVLDSSRILMAGQLFLGVSENYFR